MTAVLPQRPWMVLPLVAAASVVFAAAVVKAPLLAAGALAAGAVTLLAFAAPVAHLTILIGLTALVPFSVQNQFGFGGGYDSSGLQVSDVFLFTGLARAGWVIVRDPPRRTLLLAVVALAVFLVLAGLQFIRAVYLGTPPSVAGTELRVLLGFGVMIVALPILRDPRARQRLFAGLGVLAILLGLWAIAQWTLNISFFGSKDAGLREGVRFTTAGKGQIQGGLYAFAPAVVMASAVLISGAVRRTWVRFVVLAAISLNVAGLLFTYERTFWVATVVGLAFVVLRTSGSQRVKALVATPVVVTLCLALLATVAPDAVSAARERLLSIGQYEDDNSLRYRVVESRHVAEQIRADPILGSGPGATIYWGRAWERVKPTTYSYSHNGYLWLAWKLGIPLALLLLAVLLSAMLRRPPDGDPLLRAFALGSSAALFVLLLSSITFPSFSALAITPAMGLMVAIAFIGAEARSQPEAAVGVAGAPTSPASGP